MCGVLRKAVSQNSGKPSPTMGAMIPIRFRANSSRLVKNSARIRRNFSANVARRSSSSCCTLRTFSRVVSAAFDRPRPIGQE